MRKETGTNIADGRRILRERGLALVAVLWVMMLLSLVAVSFARTTRTEINLVRNVIDSAKAEALADAGVYRAILSLAELSLARQWRADGTAYRFEFGDGVVWISIQDEGGKIDLNKGRDEHLEGLFLGAGLDKREAAAMVDVIVDFRDEDDLHRLHGAEDKDYEDAGLPYGAKDAPFEAVDELHQVMGMTQELYDQVAPYLTVFSKRHQIDLTTAPREVLHAIPGIDHAVVEALLEAREEMEGRISKKELPIPGVPERGYFSLSSSSFPQTIRAEAHTPGGTVFVRDAVVVLSREREADAPPFRFLAWKQGARAPRTDAEED